MRRWIVLFVVAVGVLIVDQLSKQWVIQTIGVGDSLRPIPALYPLFQITHSENTGSAFGFLPQAGDLFLIIAVVVVGAMVVFYRRVPEHALPTQIAIGLICGGALGNALDRIEHGAVIDFIHYQIPNVVSNVSNLADHAIVLGVVIVFITSWQAERAEKRAEDASAQS